MTHEQKEYCLKTLKNRKTSGTDGLPPDFYKFFWIDIKYILIKSLEYVMSNGELSIEQKRVSSYLFQKNPKTDFYSRIGDQSHY